MSMKYLVGSRKIYIRESSRQIISRRWMIIKRLVEMRILLHMPATGKKQPHSRTAPGNQGTWHPAKAELQWIVPAQLLNLSVDRYRFYSLPCPIKSGLNTPSHVVPSELRFPLSKYNIKLKPCVPCPERLPCKLHMIRSAFYNTVEDTRWILQQQLLIT